MFNFTKPKKEEKILGRGHTKPYIFPVLEKEEEIPKSPRNKKDEKEIKKNIKY